MEILSTSPIHLEYKDDETYFKLSVRESSEGYVKVDFVDNYDDAFEPTQSITIHKNDFDKFVEMLNRTVNLL